VPGDWVVITAGDRSFATGKLTGLVRRVPVPGLATITSAELNPGYLFDVFDPIDGTTAPVWPNDTAVARPGGVPGQGFVATLDRVFYSLVGTDLVRKQCWGAPDPAQGGWPSATVNSVPAAPQLVAATGVPVNECTDNEVVAKNVSGLAFTYFDNLGAPVALAAVCAATAKATIARIDYTINFSVTVDGRPVTHQVGGSVRLTNLLP
jgi:hypothetical protein